MTRAWPMACVSVNPPLLPRLPAATRSAANGIHGLVTRGAEAHGLRSAILRGCQRQIGARRHRSRNGGSVAWVGEQRRIMAPHQERLAVALSPYRAGFGRLR